MGSGGGGSTTTTVDPKYNKGMLELSQEQQQWAGEMFNMFKYGVTYDPNEQVDDPSKATTKKVWVPGDTRQEPIYGGREGEITGYRDVVGAPGHYEDRTIPGRSPAGELHGYDPNAQVSEMQYLQNIVEANQSLLGPRSGAEAAQLGLTQAQATAKTGLVPYEEALQRESLSSQLRLLGPQESAQLADLLYKKNLSESQGRVLPQQEQAQLSGLALKIGISESQLRTLPAQEAANLAELAHQKASSEMQTRMIPYSESATRSGLEYQTGLNTARSELLPGQKNLAQKGLNFQSSFLDEAAKGVDTKGWMDEAQAGVQHSYKLANNAIRKDISSYGLDPSAGRYASQNRAMRMSEASGVSGARTAALRAAEKEGYERKKRAGEGFKIPAI